MAAPGMSADSVRPRLLLVGSSIIEQWVDAPRHLKPYPVVNLGVSGSTTSDWLPRGPPHNGGGLLNRMLQPVLQSGDIVVFYAGEHVSAAV